MNALQCQLCYNKNSNPYAVGPRNVHFISIRQVSSDAATLRRCTCGPPLLLLRLLLMLLCTAKFAGKKLIS